MKVAPRSQLLRETSVTPPGQPMYFPPLTSGVNR
jgi:hypothetical protein